MDQLLGVCQQVGARAQVIQFASGLRRRDPQDLPLMLDLDRYPGGQDLVQDAVDVLAESGYLDRHVLRIDWARMTAKAEMYESLLILTNIFAATLRIYDDR